MIEATRYSLLALMLGGALAAAPAAAEDKTGANVEATAEGEQGAVARAAMAQELYEYALETENALSALTAAQIMMSLDMEETEREKETKDIEGMEAPEEGADAAEAPADAEDMLASARDFAAGDPALMGVIEDIAAAGSRGRIGGASRTLSRLPAGKVDVFKVPFYGGRLAELAIVGDGDADLDLLVTDEGGNTICLDQSYSDKLYCSWTPVWDGYFYVAVKNMGRIRNSYYILTN